MTSDAVVLRLSACILGCLVVGCYAGNRHHIQETSIACYQCNSEFDPRCGDPFDPYTLGTVNCSMKKPLEHLPDYPKPVLCRKTVQKVEGKLRVIRGCGYITDERDNLACMRRTGTHDVQVLYCSCTTDLCNSGDTLNPSSQVLALTLLSALLYIHRS